MCSEAPKSAVVVNAFWSRNDPNCNTQCFLTVITFKIFKFVKNKPWRREAAPPNPFTKMTLHKKCNTRRIWGSRYKRDPLRLGPIIARSKRVKEQYTWMQEVAAHFSFALPSTSNRYPNAILHTLPHFSSLRTSSSVLFDIWNSYKDNFDEAISRVDISAE